MISKKIEKARIEYSMKNCPTIIKEPSQLIKEAIEKHGEKIAVSCSFGSCSVVVLNMALQIDPTIKVIFNNTGVEYPETYAYRNLLKDLWNLNLIETKPIKSFWQCVKEYGFPLIRNKQNTGKRVTKSYKPECCTHLKELPMKRICKKLGIEATITGLRCAESRVRMFTISQRGQYYHTTKWGSLWRYHPIAFWTHKQVFDYFPENNIPMNAIYKKGKDRSGCMPCTGFLKWEEQLAKTNLKMYRWVQKLRNVALLDDFIALEEQWLCDSKEDDSMKILTDFES